MPNFIAKNWYQSKTVWSGICKIFAGFIMTLGSFLEGASDVQTLLTGLASMTWGIYDIINRFKTSTPLNPIKSK